MQTFIHYFLHFGFIIFIALVFFRREWKKAYLILLVTMLVDLDHLMASPIFQADRISIGYHYLHSYVAIGGYLLLLFLPSPLNIIGTGLLFHMVTDLIDALFMFSGNKLAYVDAPSYELLNFILHLGG